MVCGWIGVDFSSSLMYIIWTFKGLPLIVGEISINSNTSLQFKGTVQMKNKKSISADSKDEIIIGKEEPQIQSLDLIEVQKISWQNFLEKSLKEILNEFFPIEDYTGKKFTLFFDNLYFGEPRYPLELCQQKKLTYDTPIYLRLRLVNKKTGADKKQDG